MDIIDPLAAALGAYALAALAPLLARRHARAFSGILGLAGAAFSIVAGVLGVWGRGAKPGFSLGATSIPLMHLTFFVDPLAGFALVLLGFVSGAVLLHAMTNGGPRDQRLPALLSLLAGAIALVLTATQATAFLISWETMSLAGFLILALQDDAERGGAVGVRYLLYAHIGVAALLIAFAALYAATGSLDFSAYRGLAASQPLFASIAFGAALIGFGTKAGLIPFHGWLPPAYAAAPAPGAAMMSGVMSKTAIVLMARFLFAFLGPGPDWWGYALLIAGLTSAFMGVLAALQEDDLKLALAWSSIENLGIIFAALGLASLLLSHNAPDLALVAASVALFHAANHSAFKTLLFLGGGMVERGTGTRKLDSLGGLGSKMPVTACVFLVGALAISGMPPLNGFVSEWVLAQTFLRALSPATSMGVRFAAATSLAVLAMVGGFAVAAFVRLHGIIFLGQARSRAVASARDPGWGAWVAPLMLATACVALAIAAAPVMAVLGTVLSPWIGAAAPPAATPLTGLGGATLNPAFLLVALLALGLPLFLVLQTARTPHPTAVWACGNRAENPRATYTGAAMVKPFRMIFAALLATTTELQSTPRINARPRVELRTRVHHGFDEHVVQPLARGTITVSRSLRRIQAGSIQLYLAYILVALVTLILYVVVIS
ncbi:MAG: proton-conducting transporter transmembrane domain-containing protein [Thermoplasmatota archaeon]